MTGNMTTMFLTGDIDKFEVIYTNCRSLISQETAIRTILPLEPTGMETEVDELIKMTTKDGKIDVTKEGVQNDIKEFSPDMIYEQSPE